MAKRKVYKTVKGFAYMIIGCGLMLTLFNSAITVFQRQDEIAVLEKEKKAVEKEKPPKAEVTVIISLFRHGLQSFYGSVLIETILICVNRA